MNKMLKERGQFHEIVTSYAERILMAQELKDADNLEALSYDHYAAVRSYVAANPHTRIKVLRRLSLDKTRRVQEALMRNPSAMGQKFVVQKLARDHRNWRTLLRSPNLPDEIYEEIQRSINASEGKRTRFPGGFL